MSYVIYNKKTSRIITQKMTSGEERTYFPSLKLAQRACTQMAKKKTIVLQEVEISDYDYYKQHVEQFHEVTNIMTGKKVRESVNTPYGCSVGDEAYWQN